MAFIQRFNPRPGLEDFWHEFRRPNPHRWPIMALSLVFPALFVWALSSLSEEGDPPRPDVEWINTLPMDRSDEQILAENIRVQQDKEALAAEEEARQERIKDAYRALGRASGFDIEEMEKEVAAERAASEERARARAKASAEAQEAEAAPAQDATGR